MRDRFESLYSIFTFEKAEQIWDMGTHKHETLEVSIVLNGDGLFSALGQNFSIQRGSIIVIASDIPHNYQSNMNMKFCVIELANRENYTLELLKILSTRQNIKVLRLSTLDLEQYESLFRHFLKTTSEIRAMQEDFIKGWVELLLMFLIRKGNRVDKISLVETENHIRDNLKSDISMNELAASAGLSAHNFRIAFKKMYGVSPKQYQQQKRIEEAKWLLRSSDDTISEISEYLGFYSQSYFSLWFETKEGISPTEWRKAQQF